MLRWVVLSIIILLTTGCIEGPVGPAGPQGEQGERGIQGPPGDDGTDGQDGTIEIFTKSGTITTQQGRVVVISYVVDSRELAGYNDFFLMNFETLDDDTGMFVDYTNKYIGWIINTGGYIDVFFYLDEGVTLTGEDYWLRYTIM